MICKLFEQIYYLTQCCLMSYRNIAILAIPHRERPHTIILTSVLLALVQAFEENERVLAETPLAEGPFANFLRKLSDLQRELGVEDCPIRTALVTARSAPAHERVIRTLRSWNVRVDEAFFLGGLEKKEILRAFGAQIFFDDQTVHTASASQAVPAARVPYRNRKRTLLPNEETNCKTG